MTTNIFKVDYNRLILYNLTAIVYCAIVFIYLDYYNYFKDDSYLLNESTDLKVLNHLLLITFAQELLLILILNPFDTKSTLSLNTVKSTVCWCGHCILFLVLSIFTSIILIIFLGASDLRSIVSTIQLSCLICLLTIVPLLTVFQNYARQSAYPINFPHFLKTILIAETNSFLILNFYTLIFGAYISAFALKLDWSANWIRYPMTAILGITVSNLSLNTLYMTSILSSKFYRKLFTK